MTCNSNEDGNDEISTKTFEFEATSKTDENRPNRLKSELEHLISTNNGVFTIKVKDLVEWAGYQRRRRGAENAIEETLGNLGLTSKPDFKNSHISAEIEIHRIQPSTNSDQLDAVAMVDFDESTTIRNDYLVTEETISSNDNKGVDRNNHILTVGRLEAANKTLISVKPDHEVIEATTLMLKHNFSQLPIMQNPREIKGVISWRSIVSRQLKSTEFPQIVAECMEKHIEIGYEDSLFDVFSKFIDSDYVLVRKSDKSISGIVTPFDLSEQFRELSEAFIKIGQIEAILRLIIEKYYPQEIIQAAKDPADESRSVKTVDDLTFGEYKRLLENKADWDRYFKAKVSRKVLIETLEEIRIIRNDVMHFDPDGVDIQQHNQLSIALEFFNQVKSLL